MKWENTNLLQFYSIKIVTSLTGYSQGELCVIKEREIEMQWSLHIFLIYRKTLS